MNPESRKYLENIGFKLTGEKCIVEVLSIHSRVKLPRALFHRHFLHQNTRLENEVIAMRKIPEVRDDFALRGDANYIVQT